MRPCRKNPTTILSAHIIVGAALLSCICNPFVRGMVLATALGDGLKWNKPGGLSYEIANAAVYLLSDYAAYVTGEAFVIDGGQWLSGADYWGRIKAMAPRP